MRERGQGGGENGECGFRIAEWGLRSGELRVRSCDTSDLSRSPRWRRMVNYEFLMANEGGCYGVLRYDTMFSCFRALLIGSE